MKIRPVYNFLPLRRSWIGGITIYPLIFFKRTREEVSDTLFRHELQHIYQVQKLGWIRFYVSYLWQNIRVGYKKNKYELEANAVENQPLTAHEQSIKGS
jgi:hypothetical protein